MAALRYYPVASCLPSELKTYLQFLPVDILGLVAPYLLYDPATAHEGTPTVFVASIFGRFVHSSVGASLLADRSRVLYRTYWSSNDYAAASFLAYDGTINYGGLLAHATALTCKYGPVARTVSFRFSQIWLDAYRERYDLLLATLRGYLADQLRVYRAGVTTLDDSVSARLEECLRLPDLLLVSHQRLDNEILALCALMPTWVELILRRVQLRVIHYSLWVTLYTTYIDPIVGATLYYQGPSELYRDQLIQWRRLWLQPAVRTDDVALFTHIYQYLGFTRADIVTIITEYPGCYLGIDIERLCGYDAPNLIGEFDLWFDITLAHTNKIINEAPRLRAALRARERTFPLASVTDYDLHGLPAHIAPFLPSEITPLHITHFKSPSPAIFCAILCRCQRTLTQTELNQLFRDKTMQDYNLLTYLLPVERLQEPAVRVQFAQVDQQWDSIPRIEASSAGALATTSSECGSYICLYRLFLLYALDCNTLPIKPFCRYEMYEFISDDQVVDYSGGDSAEDGDEADEIGWEWEETIFVAHAHPRMLVLTNCSPDITIYNAPTLSSRDTVFVYLAPATTMYIRKGDSHVDYTLYDYDIINFKTWCGIFRSRYDTNAVYADSIKKGGKREGKIVPRPTGTEEGRSGANEEASSAIFRDEGKVTGGIHRDDDDDGDEDGTDGETEHRKKMENEADSERSAPLSSRKRRG